MGRYNTCESYNFESYVYNIIAKGCASFATAKDAILKKCMPRILLTLLVFFCALSACLAQVSGDYESNGTGGGVWNVAATWLTYNGVAYVAAASAPSNSSNNIIIQSGDAVSVTNSQTLGANMTDNGTLTITGAGTLVCGTGKVLGTGSFTVNAGAALGIGSSTGISTTAATGNIQVTGGASFSATANYTYSGGAAQVTGNALPSPLTGSITFGNTNGSGTSLLANVIVNSPGTVTVTGALACNTFVISGTGSFTLNTGATLLTANASGISATGVSGSIQTSTLIFSDSASYTYYGAVAQVTGTGLPAILVSLGINNSSAGGVSLTNSMTLNGVLTLTNGIFCLNGNTLNIPSGRTIVRAKGSLSLCGGSIALSGTLNVNYTGTVAVTTGPEIPTSSSGLNNLTINGTGVVVTLGANVVVNGNLIMTTGTLQLGGFTLAYSGSSVLVYNGTAAQTVGAEWPSGSFGNNITVSNTFAASGVVLNTSKTGYTGRLTVINGGFFNSGSFTLGGAGNIAVNAGGTLITPNVNGVSASGAIQLTGTVTFAAGSGYIFDGAAMQVTGSEMPASVGLLTVNNATGIRLTNSLIVSGNLTMTQGNIDLNNNSLTLGASVAVPGTLNYTAGTLINTGSFTRWFNLTTIAAGGAAGLFPVGTATNYRPFSVSVPTIPTAGGTITVSYTDASTNSTVSFPDGANTVAVIKNLNWSVVPGNGLAGGSYNLDISGTGYGLVGNVSDLRITLVGSVVGTAGTNAGTTADPQVNRNGLTQGNLTNVFYLGSVNSINSPLPITLLSFTATAQNKEVILNWTTTQEINNGYFTVQRSKNDAGWENMQQIPGAGNTSGLSSYTWDDPSPYAGISYYRLMQTDLDGTQTYSGIRPVIIATTALLFLYPNPASSLITVSFPLADKYEVSLYSSSGQIVIGPVGGTGNVVAIPVLNIPDGVYFIRINQAAMATVLKVIIKK